MFTNREMPPKPRAYTVREAVILRKAALRIQRAYRRRRDRRLANAQYDIAEKKQDM